MYEALNADLTRLSELLQKYGHHGQSQVVDEILASLATPHPDLKRLAGIDMWGGSGAVWDVCLIGDDEKLFRQTVVRVASEMDRLKIGTERSRFIAKTFRDWLDKGL